LNKKVIQEYKVKTVEIDSRLDIVLAARMDVTRSNAQKLVRDALVQVNGEVVASKYLVQKGDKITVLESKKRETPKVNVIFEDQDILVIDKPAGITVHPAPGETDITISELFADTFKGKTKTDRDNIVHRLDKGTSGVMVLAKNEAARAHLAGQFAARKVSKTYLALVFGRMKPTEGVIDMPLARDLVSKNRIAPADEGKDAKTIYKVVQQYKGYALVSANPKTGRTHQIRVHFAALAHPLYGDVRYGAKETGVKRIFLHAAELSFIHPTEGKRVKFKSPMPIELQKILDELVLE